MPGTVPEMDLLLTPPSPVHIIRVSPRKPNNSVENAFHPKAFSTDNLFKRSDSNMTQTANPAGNNEGRKFEKLAYASLQAQKPEEAEEHFQTALKHMQGEGD